MPQAQKRVVVVDIEVAINKEDESNCEIDINSGKLGKKGNRIDIVTLERSTRKLRFFEAKHYTNRASLRNEERIPALCEQLSNYDSELRAHDKDIIEAYKNQIFAVNILFDTDIPLPSEIDYTTRAVIFGFDDEQKAYLDKYIVTKENGLKGRTYSIGKISNAKLETMFKASHRNVTVYLKIKDKNVNINVVDNKRREMCYHMPQWEKSKRLPRRAVRL